MQQYNEHEEGLLPMKKIMFTGIDPETTEAAIRESLERVGPVVDVIIVRDGDPAHPYVVVTMNIDDDTAYRLTTRVTDYWHNGQMINARMMLY